MDPSQLQPGFRLDRYELLCPLAYGGMASVWLARFAGRRGFERLVVVKMILPQYSEDPRFQEMFVDEARIASRIEHTNVARILDVGEHDENTFIVMEWIDGDSLSKIARASEQKRQPIPAGIALRICADAAAGLHAAHVLHERDGTPLGVVHRDVSPQNILISNAGATVLIDFGVAKARDRVSQDTSAGQLKGKVRYMAPEQALGRDVDHRADIWSLGAILYELFAGVPPHEGPNEVATLHKLTSGEKPGALPSRVPDAVRDVIERALAHDPDTRFATALELNLALESALIAIGEPTTVAVVATYTGQLLAERKSARKRAVDTALAAAHARDAERGSSAAISAGPPGVPAPAASSRGALPQAQVSGPELPASPSGTPSSLGAHGAHNSFGPMGLGEMPSSTSSTLGSASMEYPPEDIDEPARRRRFIAAAVLGVAVAAGLVGAVLIISAALVRHDDPRSRATTPPAEAIDPPSFSGPALPATAPATPGEPAAAAAVPSPAPSPLAPTPPPATTTTAPPHRPAPAAPPPRKPTAVPPAAVPTAKAPPDRGF